MGFLLYADNNQLSVQRREPITSGSMNVYPVRFEFSEEWEGMDKTASFRFRSRIVSVALDKNGECQIPWEIIDHYEPRQRLYVGVCGTRDSTVVLPTNWTSLGELLEGTTYGRYAQPPTPNPWVSESANHQHSIEEITGLAELLEQIPRSMTAAELQNILNGGNENE